VPFWKRKPLTRAEALAKADRARAHGRLRAAVAGYRQVLEEHGPDDAVVQTKLAPLLARIHDVDGALESFHSAAEAHLKAGFLDRALSVYTQAREAFPLEPDFHSEIARIHLVRGRSADAVLALVEGGQALASELPVDAAELLQCALSLQPDHLEATLLLAKLLRGDGYRAEALGMLRRLEPGVRGKARRSVRRAIFLTAPGARTALSWLRAVFAAE
jgi:tetratricopeptide (TPR) repeat protein